MRTTSVPASVRSTGTTASAPAGIGAPVMIRMAVPGRTSSVARKPAGTSSITVSDTGADSVAEPMSAARTAYPSIEELSNDGRGHGAATSSASTQPCAAMSGTSSGVSGSTPARIRAR